MKRIYTLTAVLCILISTAFLVLAVTVPLYEKGGADNERIEDYNGRSAVIAGYDGYLFRAYSDKTDEYADFKGESSYTDLQLSQTVNALGSLAGELEGSGSRVIFVFIPAKMSVYAEKLPENVRINASDERKFTEIVSAAKAAGLDVLDLSDAFKKTHEEAQLYHTASDSLNDLGGFYLYNAVCGYINEQYLKDGKMREAALDGYTLEITEDTTFPLTREYRNETGKTVADRNITLTEKNAVYESSKLKFEKTEITLIPEAKREKGYSYPNIMVYDTGMSVSSRKFFSSASALCVLRSGISADETVTAAAKPDITVFLINETELYSLPYEKAPVSVTGEVSSAPEIAAALFSDSDKYVVYGSCEPDTVVMLKYGNNKASVYSRDGEFCISVFASDQTKLTLTAKTKDKDESEPVVITAEYDGTGNGQVIVGLDGHLHYSETVPDYLGTNLYDQNTLDAYISYIKAKAERIHAVSPKTELIYVIAPNHLTIYPETAPDWLRDEKQSENSRLKQLTEAFKDAPYVTFIDLEAALLEAKQTAPERLYNKTDTHWNELGAYYAYRTIMEHIAEKYPAAAPDGLEKFNVYTKKVAGGDMVNFLGVDLNVWGEVGVYVRAKDGLKSGITKDHSMNFANAWFSDLHEFNIDVEGLPTMIMYRDSFSTNLMSFLAEKFSYSRFHSMWDYPEELDLYAEIQPDYIIYEFVERGLGGLN